MPVSRTTDLVTLREYATSVALVPPDGHFSAAAPALGPVAPWPTTVDEWAFIPVFQRGIAWSREDVNSLVATTSEVLGTTVWGSFPWNLHPFSPEPSPGQVALNYHPQSAIHLTDGLQRFTIATALLASLDLFGAFGGAMASALPRLSANFSANDLQIIRFNHHVLVNYPRTALAKQYQDFFNDIKQWVDSSKSGSSWLSNIERFFLDRRIGIDVYSGFSGAAELASNFVGLNTGSRQLGMVDIFRAKVIEDGLRGGWSAADALSFDTDLSQALVEADYSARITPLATQLGAAATGSVGKVVALPSLGTTAGASLRSETTDLLERVEPYTEPTASPSPYDEASVAEIYRCGKLPLSILAAFDLASSSPWYLQTPATAPAVELILLSRAMYRLYLAGLEGRQTDLLVALIKGTRTFASLVDLADEISEVATESTLGATRGIDDQVDTAWLRYLLEGVPKRRAARVFAACELPASFAPGGSLVTPRPAAFSPQPFGSRAAELQIDHLIPAATGGGSDPAEETLRNFAPIPAALNRAIGTLPCDAKLIGASGASSRYGQLASGSFVAARGGAAVTPHPYIEWLVNVHGPSHSPAELNDKASLRGDVGNERIDWLVERLSVRL